MTKSSWRLINFYLIHAVDQNLKVKQSALWYMLMNKTPEVTTHVVYSWIKILELPYLPPTIKC